ncbi:MAG: type III polyketide synthase [Balneolaceae bacterium]
MSAYIQHISTTVPDHSYRQKELREQMKNRVATTGLHRKLIHQIYSSSGIDTRHSILDDFRKGGKQALYYNGNGDVPGTAARNNLYKEKARILFTETAGKIIQAGRTPPEKITHLITISCTGFYAPGPDFDIIRALGLDPAIERYHLGFMGCYAAISGLKLAFRICNSNPSAEVMVISSELCTLHFQGGTSTDELISASVFADGAAGAVVSARKPVSGSYFQLRDFASVLSDEGSEDMAWTIGDTGFKMVLSTYIPNILSKNLDSFLETLLSRYRLSMDQIARWAVHPGGRAILDRIENQFNLPADSLTYSRKVLSGYGNMSSATVLYVLKEILDEDGPETGAENVLALSFGPGLTMESALLSKSRD